MSSRLGIYLRIGLSIPVALWAPQGAFSAALGTATVYRQDTNTAAAGGGSVQIALTDATGSPIELTASLPDGDVEDLALSPDGRWVVFTADSGASTTTELYSVPFDGSADPIQLSTTPLYTMTAGPFRISADSQTVVYRADQDTDNKFELYAVPIDGSAAAHKVSGFFPNANGDVGTNSFRISPDSTRVVFTADASIDTVDELYSVPMSGVGRIKLHAGLSSGDDVFTPVISPDSMRVVYVANKSGAFGQYSAAIDATGDVQISDASGVPIISGDSSRVVYVDKASALDPFEVFSVPIAGGASIRISGNRPLGASVFPIIRLAPDGETVVYTSDEGVAGQTELYAANYETASSSTKLSGTAQGASSDVREFFSLSGDGTTALYIGDQDTDETFEVYTSLLVGGGPTKVSGAMTTDGDASQLPGARVVSLDGMTQAYLADQVTNDLREVFTVTAGTDVRAHAALAAGDTVDLVNLSTDDARVLFRKETVADSKVALYSTAVGTSTDVRVSAELSSATADILEYATLEVVDTDGDLDPDLTDLDDDDDGVEDSDERTNATDPFSGDTDSDGLGDAVDLDPTTSSSLCTGADAVLAGVVVSSGTTGQCGASSSVTLESSVIVESGGKLEIYTPTTSFEEGFSLPSGAELAVFAQNPTPGV